MELSDGMNIAAYSIMNSQNQAMESIGIAVLAKVMDTAEAEGAQITQMMEQSVNPGLGANIDIRV